MTVATKLRAATPAAGAFVPTDISGCVGWWDASDTDTITDTGGLVDQWDDKSTSGYDVTAATTERPTTGTRTLNSLNVLDFIPKDQLTRSSFTLALPVTIFAVVQSDVITSNNQIVGNDSTTPTVYFSGSGTSEWRMYAGTEVISAADNVNTSAHIITSLFDGTSSLQRLDAVELTSGTSPGTNAWSNNTLRLGSDTGTSSWDGIMAEIIFYDSALSSDDIDTVESYLNGKWSVY